MIKKGLKVFVGAFLTLFLIGGWAWGAEPPIKIGVIQGFSGALEAYAKQMLTGFKMGLEYGTKGKNEVIGRKIQLIVEDDQIKPDVAKRLITKLYADDKVDMVVGTTSSAAALAMLPVAQEFKKILLVEPAVADSITGSAWNRYIFRTGRNSGQDAISNAKAVARPGVFVAAIAQDSPLEEMGCRLTRWLLKNWGLKWSMRNMPRWPRPIIPLRFRGSSMP